VYCESICTATANTPTTTAWSLKQLVNQAIRLKLDGVCFTEKYSHRASWPIGKIRAPEGFRIFKEVEISTSHGHLLVYGIWNNSWNQWARDNYMDIFKVLKNVHDMGGICVPAIPSKVGIPSAEAIATSPTRWAGALRNSTTR